VLPLFILAPLAAVIVLNLPLGLKKAALPLAAALAAAQVALAIFGPDSLWANAGALETFCKFHLQADGLSRVLLLSIGIVVFAAAFAGHSMAGLPKPRFNFFNLLILAMIGMNGTVLLADLFSLYLFLEVTSVSSFILIASTRGLAGLEGAFKYLILSAVASVLMLSSVGLLLMLAGATDFGSVKAALANGSAGLLAKLAMGAFVCGLFIKGGLVPFHGWLPAAYSAAPAPVSVLLAGIATKASGIYVLVRLATEVFTGNAAIGQALMLVGAVSIVVGALAAIGQTDMKRLLAYSSISQVGYIILGLGCAVTCTASEDVNVKAIAALALAGAVFHLFNHAIFKSLLFVNSAALEQRLGTTEMAKLGGLGGRMPATGVSSLIATLSTAGIPPLSGFWSKLIIIIALWQGGFYTYAVVAVLFSVVTLAYLLVMQRKVFFGKVAEGLAGTTEAGWSLVLPEVVLSLIALGVGVGFPWLLKSFLLPISNILGHIGT
jgi:multicomponent Na+:H+ antiporter subunit D